MSKHRYIYIYFWNLVTSDTDPTYRLGTPTAHFLKNKIYFDLDFKALINHNIINIFCLGTQAVPIICTEIVHTQQIISFIPRTLFLYLYSKNINKVSPQ